MQSRGERIHQYKTKRARGLAALRASGRGPLLLAALIAAHLGSASAQPEERRWPVCRVESLSLSSVAGGRAGIRALAALVPLGAESLLRIGEYGLLVDGEPVPSEVRRVRFRDQEEQALAVAFLIETSVATQQHIDTLTATAGSWLAGMPAQSRIRVSSFGSQIDPRSEWAPPREAAKSLEPLQGRDDLEVGLLAAIREAAAALRKAPSGPVAPHPPRRVIVVLASGLNKTMVPLRFAEAGDELARDQLVLFPIAVASPRAAIQLLGLAELAWRTNGTFRWVSTSDGESVRDGLAAQLAALRRELEETDVVVFRGKQLEQKLTKARAAGRSPDVAPTCDGRSALPRPLVGDYSLLRRPRPGRLIASVTVSVLLALGLLWLYSRGRRRDDEARGYGNQAWK